MNNNHVRMTFEFDINEEILKEKGISLEDVFKNIVFRNNDVIDGFEISTNVPGFDASSDFFLTNGKVISKEIIQQRSREDGLDKWREMILEEIDINGQAVHDLTTAEVKSFKEKTDTIDTMAEMMDLYIHQLNITEYEALERVFSVEFVDFLYSFRDDNLNALGTPTSFIHSKSPALRTMDRFILGMIAEDGTCYYINEKEGYLIRGADIYLVDGYRTATGEPYVIGDYAENGLFFMYDKNNCIDKEEVKCLYGENPRYITEQMKELLSELSIDNGFSLQEVMKECLEAKGYEVTEEEFDELWEIYEDQQEWDVLGTMTTGCTYKEVVDFVNNSKDVEKLFNYEINAQKIKLCELANNSDYLALLYMKNMVTEEQKPLLDRLIYLNQETKIADGDKEYTPEESEEYLNGKWELLSSFGLENIRGDAYFEGNAWGTGFEYSDLYKAIDHYKLITGKDINNEFIDKHSDKLMLCYEKAIDYINIDFWSTYENLLNESLTYREYVYIDAHFDGDPHEIKPADHKEIQEFKNNLADFRERYKDAIDSLCENLNIAENNEYEREVESFVPVFETDKHICLYYYMENNEWFAVDKATGEYTLILDDSYVWIDKASLNIFAEDTVVHIAEEDLMFNLADSSEYHLSSIKENTPSEEDLKGINVLKRALADCRKYNEGISLDNKIKSAAEKTNIKSRDTNTHLVDNVR